DVTVAISGLTISNGSAAGHPGGGIHNLGGMLTITNCAVSNNSSASGGGIFNQPACIKCGGALTIINSTLSGNMGEPGGGGVDNSATLTIINSTLSGNSAGVGGGGGIVNVGIVTIINSTLSGNSATGLGGGIDNTSGLARVNIKNSILAK